MFKGWLLTFGVLLSAGTAMATDITNPFYLPYQKQIGLITSASFRRNVNKNSLWNVKSRQFLLKEELQVGLTDSVAFIGSFGNTWDRWKGGWRAPIIKNINARDNENIQWAGGMAWNVLGGPTRLQVKAEYGQDRLKNFSGEYKYALGEAKFGYQFERVLPYITGGIEIPIGQKSGEKGLAGDKLIYNTKIGIYQGKCEMWSLDTGVRLTYNENEESRLVTAEAEAAYYITPSITASVYGTYTLVGDAKYGTDIYDKSVGTRLRLFF